MRQDELLLEQVTLAEEILEGRTDAARTLRLAGLVLALSSHLLEGGDLPMAWRPVSRAELPPLPEGESDPEDFEWPDFEADTSVDVDLEGL